jgi:hypothetical protein
MGVHRAAWIARHGEPPAATPFVLHRCDNPPCWRDAHLFLGTQADNVDDMWGKGRGRSPFDGPQKRCEDGPGAKLTNVQVAEVKRRLMDGEAQRSIAADLGVSHVAIGHIWRGRNFIEVTWPDASTARRLPPWLTKDETNGLIE